MTAPPKFASSREVRWFAWILAAIVLALSVALAFSVVRSQRPVVVVPASELENQMRFLVQDQDGDQFFVNAQDIAPRQSNESMNDWKARVKTAIADMGWTIVRINQEV